MPGISSSPHLIQNITYAQALTLGTIASSNNFEERLRMQHSNYRMYHVESHSLFSQIYFQFVTNLSAFNGLFFIDFDDTILNTDAYTYQYNNNPNHPIFDFSVLYNAAPLPVWIKLLQNLRQKKFFVVLCTSRVPVTGNETIFQKMIHQDLGGLFHSVLFTGNLSAKGTVIHYIRCHIAKYQNITFPNANVYLFDDDAAHLASASFLGISTFKSYRAPQYPSPCFIAALLALEPALTGSSPKAGIPPTTVYPTPTNILY